jgi:hypothetical protein
MELGALLFFWLLSAHSAHGHAGVIACLSVQLDSASTIIVGRAVSALRSVDDVAALRNEHRGGGGGGGGGGEGGVALRAALGAVTDSCLAGAPATDELGAAAGWLAQHPLMRVYLSER